MEYPDGASATAGSLYDQLDGDPDHEDEHGGWLQYATKAFAVGVDAEIKAGRLIRVGVEFSAYLRRHACGGGGGLGIHRRL